MGIEDMLNESMSYIDFLYEVIKADDSMTEEEKQAAIDELPLSFE